MSKKKYDDDDGRSIADMSGVGQPNLFTFRSPAEKAERKDRAADADSPDGKDNERPWEKQPEMPKEDRRAYVLAAVLTALGVGAVFFIVLGLLIWLMTAIWA